MTSLEEQKFGLENESHEQKLLREQNLVAGTAAALVAGLIGAAVWAGIGYAFEIQIGWLAIGIGALVGMAMRIFGKGVQMHLPVIAGGIALLSVVLGNLLTTFAFVAKAHSVTLLEVAGGFDYSYLGAVMAETFSFMDVLFYGLAIWQAFQLSFRVDLNPSYEEYTPATQEEVETAKDI
jgi:hypothetical protein